MNATLIMAFILILIVVATVITKKLPFNFVLFIVKCLDHQLFLDNGHTSYPG